MEPQIEYGEWWVVDGRNGTEFIPGDLCTHHLDVGSTLLSEDETANFSAILEVLKDYLEQSVYGIYSIEKRLGYGARLSMPGYMDCTSWTVFDTEQEARDFLEEQTC